VEGSASAVVKRRSSRTSSAIAGEVADPGGLAEPWEELSC
jgi:hypothetical protein